MLKNREKTLILILILLCYFTENNLVLAQTYLKKEFLNKPPQLTFEENSSPVDILNSFLGLPFRVDGVISDQGYWTTWQDPEKKLNSPGLNCSGFTISAARYILNDNFPLQTIKRDLFDNSDPKAKCGQDWDFGLDIILNLAISTPNQFRLFPAPEPASTISYSLNQNGRPVGWGIDLHSPNFPEILSQFKPNHLYYFVFSKPDRRFKCGLSYYHVGLILPEDNGDLWLYQSTAKAGIHRINLNNPKSLATLRHFFPKVKNGGERRAFFIEIDL
jgi:hypothetical protein